MFDRFTDRAKKVMSFARQEAMKFNHEYIGTEHILLGLVQEGSGVAANVLKNMNIDLEKIRHEVEKIVKTGPSMVTMEGPVLTIFSTSCRIFSRSTFMFLSTLAATPLPSWTSPSRMCSVPMYSWLNFIASWRAKLMTFLARSVKRSNILV